MKKSIIALMGLLSLVACSEDSYQEADKMNETGTVENNSGGMQTNTIDTSINYESPYGTSDRFEYLFINNTDYEWRFTPVTQLCFYDGTNDNVHFGHNLTAFPYFNATLSWSDEYTAQFTAKMIVVPPNTTETITMDNGKVLPVDPSGPTTASGQFFDLESSSMGSLNQNEMDFFGDYLKFVGLEGGVVLPSGATINTTIKFPLGTQYSASSNPGGSWAMIPNMNPLADVKVFHFGTKEICTIDSNSGFLSPKLSFVSFNIGSQNYTASAYTTRNQVIVVLE